MRSLLTLSFLLMCIGAANAQSNINHPSSGFVSVTLGPGTYNYYDNGGPNGFYSANVSSSLMIIPQDGYYIHGIFFNEFQLEDGPDCAYDKLEFSFLPACGDIFVNFQECGGPKVFDFGVGFFCSGTVLTIDFESDGTLNYSGWKAQIVIKAKDPKTKICQNDGNCFNDVGKKLDCSGGGNRFSSGDVDTDMVQDPFFFEEFSCWGFGPCPGSIDIYPGCSSQKFLGPERVYPLSVPELQTIVFECECLTDVFLLNASCNCVTKVPFINGQFVLENLAAGEYYLVAEYDCVFGGCSCDFQFQCIDPGPGDLDCSNLEPIGCNATVFSSNSAANGGLAKVNGYCNPSLGNIWTGRERVYSFTSDINGIIQISLSSLSANLDLFLLKACDRTQCVSWSTKGGSLPESITLTVKKGETYIIVVDGVSLAQSSYLLEVQCEEKETCDECGNCFTYSLVNKGSVTEVVCRSKFNDCSIPNFPTSNHKFRWTVDSVQVSTLQNPTLTIPTHKSVTICQEIRLGTTLINRCCWDVEAAPGCQAAPVAHWEGGAPPLQYNAVFNAARSKGGERYFWDFGAGSPIVDVGKDTLGKYIYSNVPEEKVCVYVQNQWGVSQYCKSVAPGAFECAISPSPKFDHSLSGNTLTITSDNPNGCIKEWEIDYGNGTKTEGTLWSPQSLTFPVPGVYEVCIRYRLEYGQGLGVPCSFTGCLYFTVKVGCCTTVQSNCPDLVYQFVNANNGLLYNFSKPENPNQQSVGWEVNDVPVPESAKNTIQFLFPAPGSYRICYIYRDPVTGCCVKCCKTIWVGDPFDCGSILFLYESGKGYQFYTEADGTNFTWTNDDTGEELGSGKITNFLPVPGSGNCIEVNISVRYFDTVCNCWRICCLRIFLCDPVTCTDEIVVLTNPGPNPSTALCVQNWLTEVRWSCLDNNLPIGTGNCVNITNQNCKVYCVKYYDPIAKRYRMCCSDLNSAVFEPASLQKVEIRPNPFETSLDVVVEFRSPLEARLELLDAQGRKVAELERGSEASTIHQWQLDTRHLSDGVYLIRIITAEGAIIRKVLRM